MRSHYTKIPAYTTKDGSTIRELMHPSHHGNRNQSLAEATIPPGSKTRLHKHHETEEIYHITKGIGVMTLGQEQLGVQPGDSIAIAPGTPHCMENTGDEPLVFLCCCSPAYSDDDTELLGS